MNHSRRNHKKTESTLIIRLLMLLVLMFGTFGATQAQWSSSSGNTTTTDKVGIGTTAPLTPLQVRAATNDNLIVNGHFNLSDGVALFAVNEAGNAVKGMEFGASCYFFGGGNVGIGTISPQYKVSLGASSDRLGFYSDSTHFNSIEFYNSSTGGMYFDQNTAAGGGYHWLVAGSEKLTLTYGGNVGIGTTSPTAPLMVQAPSSSIGIKMIGRAGDNSSYFQFYKNDGTTLNGSLFAENGVIGLADSAGSEVLNLKDGNVGIGKPNPTVALDVVASINLTGTINAKYQDVAEWVPASEQLSAGTVVVLDSTKSNQVTSSSVSYDTRVAGVVSEQPGLALGEKSDNKVLVATTGRVRVKVDASKGPIHIGDLLVTSDVPGMATKSEPIMIGGRQIHAPGTLIGKALEPLEKGTGTILVLLSLQ